ncbi:MAG TPA: hypothetical protein H9850_03465 [Candidatus Anaerobiospirillum pullistercoris]|uniref:Flavodoxin-like domain-containing protein n=1 Tax=Candidatus Anaerobiospirillum pullistercoris TaxID=2838452 RepID=A0A9D2B121_9GAMM|nr:hypothetical protein [Candidatus Anaerobiospirillum pullistercoris]
MSLDPAANTSEQVTATQERTTNSAIASPNTATTVATSSKNADALAATKEQNTLASDIERLRLSSDLHNAPELEPVGSISDLTQTSTQKQSPDLAPELGTSQSSVAGPETSQENGHSSLIKPPEQKPYRDAFGNRISKPVVSTLPQDQQETAAADTNDSNGTEETINPPCPVNIAVVFFSYPEHLPHESTDVDELTGASVIYDSDYQRRGLVEYLARQICRETNADLFMISRVRPYPTDHDELIYEASEEFDMQSRPSIMMTPTFHPELYDLIFIGYPIWWYDLPMPLYTFFTHFDLSGKVIVPFCVHGGSRPFKTFALIDKQEPNAEVLYNYGLVMHRQDVPTKGTKAISAWLHGLQLSVISKLRHQIGHNTMINAAAAKDKSTDTAADSAAAAADAGNATNAATAAMEPAPAPAKSTAAGGKQNSPTTPAPAP